MANLYRLRAQLLDDGRITANEVRVIQEHIHSDGQLDLEDVKLLVELLSEAKEVCPAFDDLFFPALKQVILEDGRIGADEQFYLLKMLYSDGNIRQCEKDFLLELMREADEVPAGFESLCETALGAHPTNWDLGAT